MTGILHVEVGDGIPGTHDRILCVHEGVLEVQRWVYNACKNLLVLNVGHDDLEGIQIILCAIKK